jgi:CRISPR-associated protein Csx10
VARATGGTLVLRLTGPAVFVDPAGRPRLEPDRDLDLPNGIEVDAAWTRPLHWSGWHAASRLPKPTDVCAAPGSTYRLTADPAILDAFAQRVLDEGIGLRRAEGFGVVEIATAPWRPPVPPVRGVVPPDEAQPTAQTTVQARMRSLQELALPPQGRAWLVGALRSLQIEQLRALSGQQTISPGTAAEVDTILKELMRQPTAMDLTGRQRDGIRGALTGIDPATLRDLTTLVIAAYAHDPAAASEGPHR